MVRYTFFFQISTKAHFTQQLRFYDKQAALGDEIWFQAEVTYQVWSSYHDMFQWLKISESLQMI